MRQPTKRNCGSVSFLRAAALDLNILIHGNLTLFVVALYRLLPPLEYSLLCMKSANLLYVTTLKVFKNIQYMFSLKNVILYIVLTFT